MEACRDAHNLMVVSRWDEVVDLCLRLVELVGLLRRPRGRRSVSPTRGRPREFPLVGHHVFAGNTADVSTLPGILDDLQDRFAVRRVCVVVDRG